MFPLANLVLTKKRCRIAISFSKYIYIHSRMKRNTTTTTTAAATTTTTTTTSIIIIIIIIIISIINNSLVGGFNLFEKYWSKWVNLPQIGVKIKNIRNHHLVHQSSLIIQPFKPFVTSFFFGLRNIVVEELHTSHLLTRFRLFKGMVSF